MASRIPTMEEHVPVNQISSAQPDPDTSTAIAPGTEQKDVWKKDLVLPALRPFSHLCPECESIFHRDLSFDEDSNFYPHHQQHVSLEKAMESGCRICTLLWDSVVGHNIHVVPRDADAATLRRPPINGLYYIIERECVTFKYCGRETEAVLLDLRMLPADGKS